MLIRKLVGHHHQRILLAEQTLLSKLLRSPGANRIDLRNDAIVHPSLRASLKIPTLHEVQRDGPLIRQRDDFLETRFRLGAPIQPDRVHLTPMAHHTL
jgi:hypothetical protein